VLSKTRLSVPPLGIDVFEPPLHGLIMADEDLRTSITALAAVSPADAAIEESATRSLMSCMERLGASGSEAVRRRQCGNEFCCSAPRPPGFAQSLVDLYGWD